jgi:hypothetical protein
MDDDRHGSRGMLALPLAPDVALCLCCRWRACGPDAATQAARHRDQTSHAVLASPATAQPASSSAA